MAWPNSALDVCLVSVNRTGDKGCVAFRAACSGYSAQNRLMCLVAAAVLQERAVWGGSFSLCMSGVMKCHNVTAHPGLGQQTAVFVSVPLMMRHVATPL